MQATPTTTQGSGTLLALLVTVDGDEDRARQALLNGYTLTGNFKGRELEVAAS